MKFQDIQIPDEVIKLQFVSNWLSGNYETALSILKNIQLKNKAFVAESMKILSSTLYALEESYDKDFTNALKIELDRYDSTIMDFVYKQDWSPIVSYKIGNTVVYNSMVYLCAKENVSVTPTNGETWVELGLQSPPGASTIDVAIKYEWNPVTQYIKNDVVTYNNFLWVSTQPNKNQIPLESSNYWIKFLTLPKASIIVSEIKPENVYDGLIWIEISKEQGDNYNAKIKRYNDERKAYDNLYPMVNVDKVEELIPGFTPEIIVTAPSGTEITATKGEEVITEITIDNKCTLYITSYGEWKIQDSTGKSQVLNVSEVKQYNINLN